MQTSTSLTYGTLPSFEKFKNAFDGTCKPNIMKNKKNVFRIELSDADADMFEALGLECQRIATVEQVYALCEALVNTYHNYDASMSTVEQAAWAGDFCSGILATLGFEWV